MKHSVYSVQKFILLSAVMLLTFCNTRLNEEQRKQMFEARKKIEIRQVPEADLLKAGLDLGVQISGKLNDTLNTAQLAQLSAAYQVSIKWFTPASPPTEPLLMDLMHAYVYAAQHGEKPSDHIQRIGRDTVLYVRPVATGKNDKMPLTGMWCVFIPVKKIVLEMQDN